MTTGAQILEAVSQRRKAMASEIHEHPENFCVCEGCSTILRLPLPKVEICPHCHSYRFDYSSEAIRAMAAIGGAKVLATSCAVLPRYSDLSRG